MAGTWFLLMSVLVMSGIQTAASLTGHVCTARTGYISTGYRPSWQVDFTKYFLNCGFMGFGRCSRQRQMTRQTSTLQRYRMYRLEQVCCSGWKQVGDTCTTAICTGGCGSGGECVAPETCTCPPGYQGPKCDIDVNECDTNNGGCAHTCTNTAGSYSCSCNKGFILSGTHGCEEDFVAVSTRTVLGRLRILDAKYPYSSDLKNPKSALYKQYESIIKQQ
ncbi:epidermal growth factor-like protein 8 [Lingula anatina]|uniref:Epidermal growth factor-like protein 8 n=1 Tax=Lingula anatina TaxID=7574 RepID=A0A1S3HJG3_LINAN|nr:epidermal growth factor-like protein 8 [Lingula anatina]|eukprot:XP_013386152.1 epidermal growth factor-like protein 8 [Lingula anatina]